jgi:hypothetical protein
MSTHRGDLNGDEVARDPYAASPAVTAVQEKYVRRCRHRQDLDNVLFEIANGTAALDGLVSMIDLVKTYCGSTRKAPPGA